MLSDFFSELFHFLCQLGIAFFEHIANPCEIVLVLHQHGIMCQLFLSQPFDDIVPKSRASAIFRKGNASPFSPFFKHLLFINAASKFDIVPFHFFSLRPSGAKQDCLLWQQRHILNCLPISNYRVTIVYMSLREILTLIRRLS